MVSENPLRFTSTMDASPPRDGTYYIVVAHLGSDGWETLRLRANYADSGWQLPAPAATGDRVAGWLDTEPALSDQELAAIPIDNLDL